ncbi:hypothetical protein HYALB_00009991 [Hymenoscyphus albidus]|uniref:DUF2231 domain-containing protein n=2 Tax=Hymenoscyphus TaxID=5182 RepID=A0A9N9L854_9HELO|nr:hypothetical protein HYFRA_00005218 [Hymenoscyphus fraxineus]CAG8981571.1 hypothetical protein HYALB_00009991 [Hymenoscyphus albidus]
MSNKPAHPAFAHFPIAFVTLAGLLDILHVASKSPLTSEYVQTGIKTLELKLPLEMLPLLSYYATVLALVTMVPAILSGATQMLPLIQRDGFGTKKVRTAVTHAALNDVVAGMLAYNWNTRRNVEGFAPSSINLGISCALAMPIVFFGAALGGELVYTHGMGVGKASTAKSKKAQ